MGYMYNHCVFLGRLTSDPLFTHKGNSSPRVQFSLAVERSYKKDGDKKAIVDFIPIVIFGTRSEFAKQLLVKGSPVLVWGRLQTRSYLDKSQEQRWMTEVKVDNFQLLAWHKYMKKAELKAASS
eukprot:COSAG01_NODE_2_length_63927_cov_1357.611941_35_plen_124_part_00